MPIYEFLCTNCNSVFEVFGSYENVGQTQNCKTCNYECKKIVSRPAMQPDNFWDGRYMPNVNQYVTSKSRYLKGLKRNGLAITEKGMSDQKTAEERASEVVKKISPAFEKFVVDKYDKIVSKLPE